MRIGIICPYSFDEPGGVQAHILDLATVFIEQGHHVEVLGPASTSTQVPSFVRKGGWAVPITYNGSVARLSIGPHVRRNIKRFAGSGTWPYRGDVPCFGIKLRGADPGQTFPAPLPGKDPGRHCSLRDGSPLAGRAVGR